MRRFFDTNILVYLFDNDAPDKKSAAQELIEQEARAGSFQTGTQVLQELYVVLTRKLANPLASETAEHVIRDFAQFQVVQVDVDSILKAIPLQRRLNFSFRDALIVQTAMRGGASILYTEDLQHGQEIHPIKIVNPFLESATP